MWERGNADCWRSKWRSDLNSVYLGEELNEEMKHCASDFLSKQYCTCSRLFWSFRNCYQQSTSNFEPKSLKNRSKHHGNELVAVRSLIGVLTLYVTPSGPQNERIFSVIPIQGSPNTRTQNWLDMVFPGLGASCRMINSWICFIYRNSWANRNDLIVRVQSVWPKTKPSSDLETDELDSPEEADFLVFSLFRFLVAFLYQKLTLLKLAGPSYMTMASATVSVIRQQVSIGRVVDPSWIISGHCCCSSAIHTIRILLFIRELRNSGKPAIFISLYKSWRSYSPLNMFCLLGSGHNTRKRTGLFSQSTWDYL
jgi:hypothetical protein